MPSPFIIWINHKEQPTSLIAQFFHLQFFNSYLFSAFNILFKSMAGWAWVGKGADLARCSITAPPTLQFSDITQKKVSFISDIKIF